MPVLLRIPRIVEEPKIERELPQPEAPRHQPEFRWRVGIGVSVLMLIAAIPWIIRWRPATDSSLEALAPTVLAIENDSDIEVLPPLYAKTDSSPPALPNLGKDNENSSEFLESLVAPHPPGGPQ